MNKLYIMLIISVFLYHPMYSNNDTLNALITYTIEKYILGKEKVQQLIQLVQYT